MNLIVKCYSNSNWRPYDPSPQTLFLHFAIAIHTKHPLPKVYAQVYECLTSTFYIITDRKYLVKTKCERDKEPAVNNRCWESDSLWPRAKHKSLSERLDTDNQCTLQWAAHLLWVKDERKDK